MPRPRGGPAGLELDGKGEEAEAELTEGPARSGNGRQGLATMIGGRARAALMGRGFGVESLHPKPTELLREVPVNEMGAVRSAEMDPWR